jgi:hypothetical protein
MAMAHRPCSRSPRTNSRSLLQVLVLSTSCKHYQQTANERQLSRLPREVISSSSSPVGWLTGSIGMTGRQSQLQNCRAVEC